MCSPNSASARWNLYGLAEQNEASLEGKKAYVTGICVVVPHLPHTPARLVASLLSLVHVSSESVHEDEVYRGARSFNEISLMPEDTQI